MNFRNLFIIFSLAAILVIPTSLFFTSAHADTSSGLGVSVSRVGDTSQIYSGLAWEPTEVGPNLWSVSNDPSDDNLRNLSTIDGHIIQTISFQNSIDTCSDGCTDVNGATALAIYGGTLYAAVNLDSSEKHLVTIDKSTGVFTDIGVLNHNFAGLAFDTAGTLYGVTSDSDESPSTLFTISTSDASTTSFLSLGATGGQSIAFNPDDGFLYYAAGSGEGSATFERIDLTTKAIASINLNSSPELTNVPIASLTYSTDDHAFFWADTNSGDTLFKVTLIPSYPVPVEQKYKGLAFVGPDLYSVAFNDNQLRKIDPVTGTTLSNQTILLSGHTVLGGNGLASYGGTLYALLKLSGSPTTRELVTINPTTGVSTDIGNTGGQFAGLAFDSTGILYGVTGDGETVLNPASLYTISTSNAATTMFLALGTQTGDGEAIGFNPDDGFLYHASGFSCDCAVHPDPLVFEKINLQTKTKTPLDVSYISGLPTDEPEALTYWSSEHAFLWAQGFLTNQLYKISVNQVAPDYPVPVDGKYKGLAFVGPDLYSVSPNDNNLRKVDPVSGATLSSVTITLLDHPVLGGNGLASYGGTLYALLKLSGSPTTRELVTINPTTGVSTDIGNTGGQFAGLAFDSTGILYGVTGDGETVLNPATLYTINTSTGAATKVLDLGTTSGYGEAIGFNPDDGLMYHSSGYNYCSEGCSNNFVFEKINLQTKVRTPVVLSNFASIESDEPEALTYWNSQHSFLWTQGNSANQLFKIGNAQKHHTQLVLNPIGDVVAGTGVGAIGTLVDTDTGAGVDGQQITFTGTGATGASGLIGVNTQGITFAEGGTGMLVASCPTCTPELGSKNILYMHAGSYMTFPPGTVGIAFTLQDMGTNGFQMQVTNKDGVKALYNGAAGGPDITVFSPPSDLAGITRIDIVSVSGTGNFGISEIQTGNPGGDPTTIYETGFGGVTPATYNNLEVVTGSYSSIGLAPSAISSGLTVQAHFAGNSSYYPSDSNTVSFSTISPTFGIGGSEKSGVLSFNPTPFTSFRCSNLDPDTDHDSLCDSWEGTALGQGIPYAVGGATFHYPLIVAKPNHKDVFVEADAMTGVWSATYQSAINDVIKAFSKAPLNLAPINTPQRNPDNTDGINLHVVSDEVTLTKTNALNVWTDSDNIQTNDFFSIKAAHFGTATEHPTLGGTAQANGPASAVLAPTQTITVSSGMTLTTPTLPAAIKNDNTVASGSATQGTISINQLVTFGGPTTITTPITPPVQTVAPTAGLTWLTPSATILSGANSAQQIIAITIPFRTDRPIANAPIGSISTMLSLTPPVSITSVVTAVNSPTVTDTLLQAKAQAYHYSLFADCITACGAGTNPSGLSEQVGLQKGGNDFIVGLGPESGFTASENNTAGTFMHELGHNLGLQHGGPTYIYTGATKTPVGGDAGQNCKPNYESVMSYTRQFNTYLGSAWTLDYSRGTFGQLSETGLSEPTGLVGNAAILSTPPTIVYGYNSGNNVYKGAISTTVNSPATGGIDWNHDNDKIDTGLNLPIQDVGITDCNNPTPLGTATPIKDYNDWVNLNYNFTSAGTFNGFSPNPITQTEQTSSTVSLEISQVTPHWITSWGSFGTGNTQFKIPSGVAVDSAGNVFVADSGNNRIVKFSNNGVFMTKWGSTGTGDGKFNTPTGIAVDATGNVYVTDSGNNRIEKFSNNGGFMTKWGSTGSGDGQFKIPSGISVDSSGKVYVVDSGNSRIEKFSGSGNGPYTLAAKWGSSGTGDGKFIAPTGITTDSSGNVYVVDSGNSRVEKFSNTGTFAKKWGSFGTGDGQFKIPSGVAVDSFGNVYVSDSGNNRIEEFTNTGDFITKWGSFGTANGKFAAPTGITVDFSGNIFTTDSGNNRIEKWGL